MSRDKKVSDKQLRKEIEQGKTFKQIAYDYGYGYPSGTLGERAKEMGYRHNHLFTVQDWGGATISLDSGTLEKAQELSGVDTFEEDGKEKLFKHNNVVEDPNQFELEEGDIVLRLSEQPWRRVDSE